MAESLRANLEKFMKDQKYPDSKIGHILKQLKRSPFINFQHLESLLGRKEFALFKEMDKKQAELRECDHFTINNVMGRR